MFFQLDENQSMVEYPYYWSVGYSVKANEILSTFFSSQRLLPTWHDCQHDYGTYNETLGLWTGAVADVIPITSANV